MKKRLVRCLMLLVMLGEPLVHIELSIENVSMSLLAIHIK